ncbi:MAG: hypothetical protein FD140_4513 [Limisphaerales bacterium]|nr:MAG: hypothetical protein FD140_4513 [Limisphaerales bacterium]
MVEFGKSTERKHHTVSAVAGLVGGALVMTFQLIQRLPAELTVTKSAPTPPSSASHPGLFDTLLAVHPTLPAAHEAIIGAFSRFRASLRPEPESVSRAVVIYEADEHGNFVPVR